jgi:hypothetical protein
VSLVCFHFDIYSRFSLFYTICCDTVCAHHAYSPFYTNIRSRSTRWSPTRNHGVQLLDCTGFGQHRCWSSGRGHAPLLHHHELPFVLVIRHYHPPRPAQIDLCASMSQTPTVVFRSANPHGYRYSIGRSGENEEHGALPLLHYLAPVLALYRDEPGYAPSACQ